MLDGHLEMLAFSFLHDFNMFDDLSRLAVQPEEYRTLDELATAIWDLSGS